MLTAQFLMSDLSAAHRLQMHMLNFMQTIFYCSLFLNMLCHHFRRQQLNSVLSCYLNFCWVLFWCKITVAYAEWKWGWKKKIIRII